MIKLSNEAKILYRDEIQPLLKQNKVKECTDVLLKTDTDTSKEVLAGLCEMGYAFVGYKAVPREVFNNFDITKAIIPEGIEEVGKEAFIYCEELISMQLPKSLRYINENAFLGCTSLTQVEIPEGVEEIGAGIFEGCENLTSIQLPNSLRSIGVSAFYNCTSLKQVEIPEGIEEIKIWTFLGCENLTSVKLPSSIRSIKRSAFSDDVADVVFYIPKDFRWEDVLKDSREVDWYKEHSKVR